MSSGEVKTDELILAFADGGSRGNPGPAAIGALLKQGEAKLLELSEFIGNETNNVAEYTGLVRILEEALKLGVKHIEVRMDSELVVKQMLGQYRVKNAGLQPLFIKAQSLSRQFNRFNIVHVRREYNKEADKLANLALDLANSSGASVI